MKVEGLVGDGKTVNTGAIQKAIDDCSKSGGGTVKVGEGRFVTGTIQLKDGVTLWLEKGAVLLGSTDIKDYKLLDSFTEGTGKKSGLFLVGAVEAKNVGIGGEGMIDGQGDSLQKQELEGQRMRPFLVRWVRCDGVKVSGVKLTKSAMWCMHISQSKHVGVDGVTIVNHGNGNNDGIDIDSSEAVKVTGCDIDSQDDAMCLKSTSAAICKNIVVSDCRLKSNCAAVKFGTESYGGFEDVTITKCAIRETRLGGIKILSVDGGNIKNVVLSDLTMDSVTVPIFLRLGSRLKTFQEADKGKSKETGTISGVTIRNVKVKDGKQAGVMISGVPGHEVGPGILLENIEMELAGGGKGTVSETTLPENEKAYPEIKMFGASIPGSAIWGRHVKGLTVKGLKVKTKEADLRATVVLDDAKEVVCSDVSLPGGNEISGLVQLANCQDVLLDKVKAEYAVRIFLSLLGGNTRAIRV
jgi:polygalacturonase